MAKITKCDNCGTENPYYQLKCKSCQSFLRRRVVNIELWETIGKVIESPSKAFENVIFAEHKNFLILMIFFFSFAVLTDLNLANNYFYENSLINISFIAFGIIVGMSLVNALVLKFTFLAMNSKTRFLDNLYLTIFASTPQIFSLILLLPVQFALFGEFWFTFNPSPLAYKEMQSWIVIGLEAVLLLWSFVLFVISFKVETGNIIQAIFGSIISIIMIYLFPLIIIHTFLLA